MLLFEDEDGYPFVLPVWPTRSFAEMMAANLDETFEAFNLPLSIFLNDLIVDIENDSGAISIFPNENDTIIQTRDEIKEMIRILYQAEYFMLNGELYHKRNRIFIELPEQFCPIMSNNN